MINEEDVRFLQFLIFRLHGPLKQLIVRDDCNMFNMSDQLHNAEVLVDLFKVNFVS